MPNFMLKTDMKPAGDQPRAIEKLVENYSGGKNAIKNSKLIGDVNSSTK